MQTNGDRGTSTGVVNGWAEERPWEEMAVMRQFNHPNLLPLYAAELDPPRGSGSGSGSRAGPPRRANLIFPAYPEAGFTRARSRYSLRLEAQLRVKKKISVSYWWCAA